MSSTTPQPLMATFDSIQAHIFTPLCANCHSGASPPADLALDATHSYNDLINIPSTEDPSIVRVKPGFPMQSFLVLHMQKEGDGASASDLATIEQWITDGAAPSATAMSMAEDFEVAAVEPDSGDQEDVAPPRVIVGFTQELDANRLDGASVLLERVEADSQTAPVVVSTTVSIPPGNARALIVTPISTLRPGNYRIVVDPIGGLEIGSIGGAVLSAPERDAKGERIITRFTVAPSESGAHSMR